MGLVPAARISKEQVNYRQFEKCGTCIYFFDGSCELVNGNIASDAVCDLWSLTKISNRAKDGKFYLNELAKTKTRSLIEEKF